MHGLIIIMLYSQKDALNLLNCVFVKLKDSNESIFYPGFAFY